MNQVGRSELVSLVSKWVSGELDERAVHEYAEAIWSQYEGPRDLPRDDSRSIAVEVLAQLEILNHQFITTEDVPAILAFLQSPEGTEVEAWRKWERYWDSLDMARRKAQLASNPYYAS